MLICGGIRLIATGTEQGHALEWNSGLQLSYQYSCWNARLQLLSSRNDAHMEVVDDV